MESTTVWICDYDISSKEAVKKRFYRALHKLLGVAQFSSLSCYVLRDEAQARAFYDIAHKYAKHAHLYRAEEVKIQ